MYRKPIFKEAVIAAGGTTTGVIETRDFGLTGIVLPAAMTQATLAIHACGTKGGTYVAVTDSDGNAITIPATASRAVGLSGAEADAVAAYHFIKLVAPGAEAAERTIGVALK